MHIIGNVFYGECNGVPGGEQGVHNNAEVFNLEISLVQGFEGASIVKVVVKRYGKVGICDGGDESGIFSKR